MDDMTLIQLFAQLDAHTARQDEILARMDDRDRQHTDILVQISGNMARVADALDRMDQRHATEVTQLGELLGGMAAMLARMDEHTTMIAQILSQFQQGSNGHA